jgi:hypothetical protein
MEVMLVRPSFPLWSDRPGTRLSQIACHHLQGPHPKGEFERVSLLGQTCELTGFC